MSSAEVTLTTADAIARGEHRLIAFTIGLVIGLFLLWIRKRR